MKLTEGRDPTTNLVRSYDADGVVLASGRHAFPLLLTATVAERALEGSSLETLTEGDVERIVALEPNLVLAGGASGAPRVPAALRQRLEGRRIAVEAMQLGAACRTFNVLVQEDRAVLALLLP